MNNKMNEEIKKEEKIFNILFIAVLSPLLLGAIVISVYIFN